MVCGGFRVAFEDDEPVVRTVPGDRRLQRNVTAAILQGLREAPALLTETLRLRPVRRPYERVEVMLARGALVQGEAGGAGGGSIRPGGGGEGPPGDAARPRRPRG